MKALAIAAGIVASLWIAYWIAPYALGWLVDFGQGC
jgi:hypothetical protein